MTRCDARNRLFGAAALIAIGLLAVLAERERLDGHELRVHAVFSLESPSGGPFPSNWFTVTDPSQNTGLRIDLLAPDCLALPSDCEDVGIINTLDGFNLQPRLSVPFDGDIDPNTVTSRTVLLVSLGNTTEETSAVNRVIGINQVVWDPGTTTLHVESDELLDQHTCYALVVTNGVRDRSGVPVEATAEFRRFATAAVPGASPNDQLDNREHWDCAKDNYQRVLRLALRAARRTGAVNGEIVSASVFTTLSATSVLEKIRDQLPSSGTPTVSFNLGPGGARTNFALAEISGITLARQIRASPPGFSAVAIDLPSLRFLGSAAGGIAYGKYASPDYLVHPGEYMPSIGTRSGTPLPLGMNDVYFDVIYPSGAPPAGGWPVTIYGHGAQGNKDEWLARVAGSLAAEGIATIGINTFATGFGPLSTVTVQGSAGSVTFPSGGRSIDQNQDNVFGSPEGIELRRPYGAIFLRDPFRQQVVDWMQLVRVIQAGLDYDGDGARDLDPSRIYYVGQSHGGMLGAILSAVEPAIHASVLNAAGGSIMEHTRLSAVAGRQREGSVLAARVPSLLNAPGVVELDGVAEPGPFWFENKPLRDGVPLSVRLADDRVVTIQAPVINDVAGTMDIQRVQEWKEWCSMAGDPIAYAPHLSKQPLNGVPAKQILLQFYLGDPNVENPQTSALIRAGDLRDRATFYRHDLAYADNPALAKNPHQFFQNLNVAANQAITLALQRQAARFLASDGQRVEQPLPVRYFEVPIQGALPESLNYIR